MRCRRLGEGASATYSKPKVRKGLWSPEEDEKLTNYIMKNGPGGSWNYVAKQAGLQRCGKSCRLRWINYLRPGLRRGVFSSQEEQMIIHLQSILGNRWSQVAAHMRGRTDNEIKNFWNTSIKKKLKLKNHPTLLGNTNCKSNIPSQSDRIGNANSLFALDAFTSSHSIQPYLFNPEAYRPSNNTFHAVTTGENQLCVPGIWEFKYGQVYDQNDEISIDLDPTNNQLISYFQLWIGATSTHTNESVSTHAAQASHTYNAAKSSPCDELMIYSCTSTVPHHKVPTSGDFSLASTGISVPAAFVESSQSLIEEFQDDGDLFVNENNIMINSSSFTGAASSGTSGLSASHSYSNIAADCSHGVDLGAYTTHETEISIMDDYEKPTHQSFPPLNSGRSLFGAPGLRWPVGQGSGFQGEDDCSSPLNLRYDVNLGIPTYIGINSMQKSYQLPQIDGRGGIGHQRDYSRISIEEANTNPIPIILGSESG